MSEVVVGAGGTPLSAVRVYSPVTSTSDMTILKSLFQNYTTNVSALQSYFQNHNISESISNWDAIKQFLRSGIVKYENLIMDGLTYILVANEKNSCKPDKVLYELIYAAATDHRPTTDAKTQNLFNKIIEVFKKKSPAATEAEKIKVSIHSRLIMV